jgi:ribokinase
MTKIICVGSTGKDIFFPTNDGKIIETPEDLESQRKIAFELGSKIRIKDRFESLGGCAANVAIGLARLGVEASCVSNVGDDSIGEWAIEELKKNNVETNFIKIEEGKKSDFSAIVVDENSADRVIFTNKNSSGELNLGKEIVQQAEWFFVSDVHGDWQKQVAAVIDLAKNENKKIAFNPREVYIKENPEEIIRTISDCEIIFVNKDEALEIISNLEEKYSDEELNSEEFLLKKLALLGAKIVALTDGKRGAWVFSDGEVVSSGEVSVLNALDSTGAGDAFASGFLASYVKEKEIAECLRWGIAQSTGVVTRYGAIEGLLTEEEMLKRNQIV